FTMAENLPTMPCRKFYSRKKEKIDIKDFVGSTYSALENIDIEDEHDCFEEQNCNINECDSVNPSSSDYDSEDNISLSHGLELCQKFD
ncbi:hypothetical protein HHI36_008934, partial [Cryptolaemus montrouzieri]